MVEEVKLPTYETLLTEAIRSLAVDSGTVTSPAAVGGNILQDSTKSWANDVHKNRLVKIIRGSGAGQLGVISNNTKDVLVVKQGWSKPLDTTSVYVILSSDIGQVLRDVFGAGSDISVANPLETHDPKVEDVEDKLDHPTYGLAALKAAISSIAGGAFYGSYGPKNVEVGNDVDFGIILYDPAGNIITTGEITPGTYTVHRVRGAVDTEIVAATASSEAAGRVYMTYDFPVASWQVGDIFYVTFSGITVTLDGVITEYPDLYIWGRVVRELDISGKVDAVEAKLDAAFALTVFKQETAPATDVNGVTWKDLLDMSTITKRTKICGFTVTVAGSWAGKARIRITDGAGNKIFPFQNYYEQDTDFASDAQVVFNFPVEVPVVDGYKFQFCSSNVLDGAGDTLELNNLDVIELG
jgi:hypothetical protein